MNHVLILDLQILHLVIKQLLVSLVLHIILRTRKHDLNRNKLTPLILVNVLLNIAIQSNLLVLGKIRIIKAVLVIKQIGSNHQTALTLFRRSKNILNTELAEIHLLLSIPVTCELTCNNNTTIIIRKMLLQMLNHIVNSNKLLPSTMILTKINNILAIISNLRNNVLIKTIIPSYIQLFIICIHCLNNVLLTIKSLYKSHVRIAFLDTERHRQHFTLIALVIFLSHFLAERTLSICLLLGNNRCTNEIKSCLITHLHLSFNNLLRQN